MFGGEGEVAILSKAVKVLEEERSEKILEGERLSQVTFSESSVPGEGVG